MEEEIDLRPYVSALVRRWRIIAFIVLMAAIGAAIIAVILPANYTASTDILILPSQSQVTFDPRFVTDNAVLGPDANSRRQSLIALASSPVFENQVRAKLPVDLAGLPLGALARRIRIRTEGDLLHIETSDANPQTAQVLADSWGQAYTTMVNNLYARSDRLSNEIETQLSTTQQRYDAAQHNLEVFIGGSTIVQVSQEISMTTALLDESVQSTRQRYAQYLGQSRALEATLHDAETLRQQVAAGQTEGLANGLVSLALRARAAGDAQLPIDLRFDDPSMLVQNSGATLADLDALIGVLHQRREALVQQSQQLAQAIDDGKEDSGLPPALRETYMKRLGQLYQESEQQTAQLKLLQQRRNLALESLTILQRKLDEQRVALGTSDAQVRLVSTIVEPPRPAPIRILLFAGAAAFAGLFLSIFAVFGLTVIQRWWPARQLRPHPDRPLDRPTAG